MKNRNGRNDDSLPAKRSRSAPAAAPAFDSVDDFAHTVNDSPPQKRVTFRLIKRALRRYWWQSLLVWLAISAGLMALAYHKILPTYDAVARIRVDIDDNRIFTQNNSAPIDIPQYIENQVQRVTSSTVLSSALSEHPELNNLPFLVGSPEPEATIREALHAGVLRGSSLIQVEMSSTIPEESAAVVNAVVGSYLKLAQATYDASTQHQIDQLVQTRDEQKKLLDEQRKFVETLHKSIGAASVESVKDRSVASLDKFKQWNEQLTSVEIMVIATKARLDQLKAERGLPLEPLGASVNDLVVDAFYEDPRVVSLQAELERTDAKLKDIERTTARNPSDPSRVRLTNHKKELQDKKNELWKKLEPGLRKRVSAPPAEDSFDVAIKQTEAELAAYTTQEKVLKERLEKVRVESKDAEGEVLKLEYARSDLTRVEGVYETILKNLNQLKFEAKSPVARSNLEHAAKISKLAKTDRRKQAMIAAPIITGLLLLGLLVLMELHGARVADPDELATRVNLQVIGVVPPLPQIRVSAPGSFGNGDGNPLAARGDFRAQRQLDEFVQSLDHLRVALCARRDPWGRDRHCVLITSACGSEGKTTLAAQLAERCVNAGLMTLLIDADLRNPTLSRMLDATDNPGLINVLRGEVMAEDVVMVIGDAGGFHLLPAGTPRVDPSRLLQSERLGKLLAQARESFDMIIVDAPPVLPVPDALTIGRWTDGAVLAVRYDTSRFPLVERANRRLAHVGVPVIGAVVNGVRSSDSAYGYGGSYGYGTYGTTVSAPTDAPIPPEANGASAQSSMLDD